MGSVCSSSSSQKHVQEPQTADSQPKTREDVYKEKDSKEISPAPSGDLAEVETKSSMKPNFSRFAEAVHKENKINYSRTTKATAVAKPLDLNTKPHRHSFLTLFIWDIL